MSELYVKSQYKLELNRVLEMLSGCASSADGKNACLALTPTSDLDEVRARLEETTAASNLSTKRPRAEPAPFRRQECPFAASK